MKIRTFDRQGHRGARGLAPENTLAGFALALEAGVTTLETDLGLTRDGVVVLSHDRRLNPDITRGRDGRWLSAPAPLVRELTWAELQLLDVGRINPQCTYASRFPCQVPADGSRIPSLAQLFELGEASGRRPRYNIETKISPLVPDETEDAERFVASVAEVVRRSGVAERTTIQSFDWRTLLISKRIAPEISTVALTIDTREECNLRGSNGAPSPWLAGIDAALGGAAVPALAQAAGCAIWSPYWRNVDAASVRLAHQLDLSVVPWTVNDPEDIGTLVAMGVDGLITDYPDVASLTLDALAGSRCCEK